MKTAQIIVSPEEGIFTCLEVKVPNQKGLIEKKG